MRNFLIILSVVLVLTILGLMQLFLFSNEAGGGQNGGGVTVGAKYEEIVNPSAFVNTEGAPVQIADYLGTHIILFEFMTYTCVNCQRTFPYMVKWYDTYKDRGLMVIGIHTPEFAFEKEIGNVEKAMAKSQITFPVVLDNDYSTWNAYGNTFWPRRYLIDLTGTIVYDHIGEGGYEETEVMIQELLETI